MSVLRGYEEAQVCIEGHIVSMFATTSAEKRQDRCVKCGAATVMECAHCQEPIRGYLHGSGESHAAKEPPSFCHKCGKPYLWVDKKLAVGTALIEEMQGLSDSERDAPSKSLGDLVRDVPATEVAVVRFKKYLPKAGAAVYDAFKAAMISVVTDEVKKKLFGL
jgi:hypothetical protein